MLLETLFLEKPFKIDILDVNLLTEITYSKLGFVSSFTRKIIKFAVKYGMREYLFPSKAFSLVNLEASFNKILRLARNFVVYMERYLSI